MHTCKKNIYFFHIRTFIYQKLLPRKSQISFFFLIFDKKKNESSGCMWLYCRISASIKQYSEYILSKKYSIFLTWFLTFSLLFFFLLCIIYTILIDNNFAGQQRAQCYHHLITYSYTKISLSDIISTIALLFYCI